MWILVVEDDERVSQFLYRGLREEGYQVDVCGHGELAREQGTRQPYDLILLDWSLPGLDGISLLRHWRQAGVHTPVIMLTARSGVDPTVLALDTGADDYLVKPFSFEELLARVRANLRRSQPIGGAQVVAIGATEVDLQNRTVKREGNVETLSSREFSLLAFLLKHRGEVLSRARILDRVWGSSEDLLTNVVDVYIRYLRNKLDGPGTDSSRGSVIETVRGRGYRLRPQGELA